MMSQYQIRLKWRIVWDFPTQYPPRICRFLVNLPNVRDPGDELQRATVSVAKRNSLRGCRRGMGGRRRRTVRRRMAVLWGRSCKSRRCEKRENKSGHDENIEVDAAGAVLDQVVQAARLNL